MEALPLDASRWSWDGARPVAAVHRGRACSLLGTTTGTAAGLDLRDGTIEVELAVGAERGFHGVFWRGDGESFESFFVRPHQVGNPDAIQYTPAFHGVSSWQLYHGAGFWEPIEFPLGDWFTIRVVFAGARAEIYVADLDEPALVVGELRLPPAAGRVGIAVGGPPVHVARFAAGGEALLRHAAPPSQPPVEGAIGAWWVSDPFPEAQLTLPRLDPELVGARTWTRLDAEPSGLADLARVNALRDGRDTVLARATLVSPTAQTLPLDVGFSDRAVVYLRGRALYRGDDAYRTRDYRFLGSIGWWDTVWLPLERGENELVVAVSEDFGGWGVQARLPADAVVALA